MKYIFRWTLIAALGTVAFSCNDLDADIKEQYTDDFEINNPGVGIKNNVNRPTPNDGLQGAFSRLLNGTANHGSYFSVQEISSDEAVITQKGGDWFDGGIWLDMHRHNFSSTNGGIDGAWTDNYNGIAECNNLLATNLSAEAEAQIRMLRAYFYWRLLDMFGNVKLIVDKNVGVNVPQSNRAAVFDFIEDELLAVIPDLPPGRAAYGRTCKATAYALLSRLYLNAEIYKGVAMYDEAIDAADMVINSGNYNLASSYANLFAADNAEDKGADPVKVSEELIFIVPFDEATGTGMNFGQMTLHYPSQLTYSLAQQPWNGYSTLEEFYNSYEDGDLRKENNFIVGPQVDLEGNAILDLAYDKADPDGAPINYTPEINQLEPNGSRQAGARLGKFRFKLKQNPDMDNDYPLLRYAEVLLNKAEALCRTNGYGDGTALALVNQVRARAGVDPLGALTAGELLAERGRELFIEGLRRTDLIRFGAWGNAWWEKPSHAAAHKNLMAIPQSQINVAAPTAFPLTQNPGY
jgi:hypothetical protein